MYVYRLIYFCCCSKLFFGRKKQREDLSLFVFMYVAVESVYSARQASKKPILVGKAPLVRVCIAVMYVKV